MAHVKIFRVTTDLVDNQLTKKFIQSFPPDEDTQHWHTEKIREFVNNPQNILILACADDEIAGFVFGWEIPRLEQSKQFYIDEVATLEKYQRQGIAKSMLSELKSILENDGFGLMYVLTEEANNAANGLYNSFDPKVKAEKGVVMYTYEFKHAI